MSYKDIINRMYGKGSDAAIYALELVTVEPRLLASLEQAPVLVECIKDVPKEEFPAVATRLLEKRTIKGMMKEIGY